MCKHRIIVSRVNIIILEQSCETSSADKVGDIIDFLPLIWYYFVGRWYLLMKENKLADLSISFSV